MDLMRQLIERQAMIMRLNKVRGQILGYKEDYEPIRITDEYTEVESVIKDLVLPSKVKRPFMNIQKVKTGAKEFYGKYFAIHQVPYVSIETVKENQQRIGSINSGATIARQFNSLCKMVEPFDIPITLVEGHSMVGETQKPLIISELPGFKENVKIPFANVLLGKNLTDLSIATYIHEIAHILTESNPGYATSYHNKEVISIFLEKVAALELDPTKTLLRISERMRFAHLYQMIQSLKQPNSQLNYDAALFNSSYIKSILLATNLFDKYQNSSKEQQMEIMNQIQQIFDKQITVEDLLISQEITLESSKKADLIRKHI